MIFLGILNNTKTTLGRSLLHTWLLRPSLSIPVIVSRQNAVVCFLRSENLVTANTMHNHLKGLKNVPRILGLMKDGRAKLSDWQGLVKVEAFLHSGMTSRNWGFLLVYVLCNDAPRCDVWTSRRKWRRCFEESKLYSTLWLGTSQLKFWTALGCSWYHDLQRNRSKSKWSCMFCAPHRLKGSSLFIYSGSQIDWEESSYHDRVCIRPHIDKDLDNRKHIYHGIDSVLVRLR